MSKTVKDYEGRDLAILRHGAEYGIVLQAVLSELFFAGKQCGHIIRRLADGGDLELFSRALPGRISYARLTKAGCARIGIPERASRPISGHALNQAVSLVTYCFLGPYQRMRLTQRDLKGLLGDKCLHPNIPHVLLSDRELGQFAVFRVVFARGSIRDTKKHLGRLLEEADSNSALSEILSPKSSYGHLLLSPNASRKKALEDLIRQSELLERHLIVCDVAPGVEELPAYLKTVWKAKE